jgi:hypothetical protein
MNKPLLTIGILLSIGTIGCAGAGVQPASSLTARLQNRTGQGVDALWDQAAATPRKGLQSPSYAGALGDLWILTPQPANRAEAVSKTPSGSLGDLWNPSSVTRHWAADPSPAFDGRSTGIVLSENGRSRRLSRKSSAQ